MLALAAIAAPSAGAATPAYITPMMAHTAWTATDNCKAVSGVVTLPGVLSGHANRGSRHRRRQRRALLPK
jgi:hypothetical protein